MKSVMLASALVAGTLVSTANGGPLPTEPAIVEEVVYVTKPAVDVVVYVDDNGKPYLTKVIDETLTLTTLASVLSPTSASTVIANTLQPTPQVFPNVDLFAAPVLPASSQKQPCTSMTPAVVISTPSSESYAGQETSITPSPSPPESTTAAESSSTSQGSPTPEATFTATEEETDHQDASSTSRGLGITYDPFTGTQTSARCKTEDEIDGEFANMTAYGIVRIYGMGCNVIPIAMKNVVKYNQYLMAGAYLDGGSDGENLTLVIDTLHDAVNQYAGGNWSVVQIFSVENEQVNDHAMTASAVVSAINSARSQLQSLGYTGLVGAVETVPAMIDNPTICQASDAAMVNCHAFFDSNTASPNAGSFVKSQVAQVQSACNSKRVIVTESGWPHQGDTNGQAVPSPQDQANALASLRSTFNHDLFIHNSFDSTWKSDNQYTFNAERFWGVMQ